MTSLKIHGVRNNKKAFIRAYLIYIYILITILIFWIVIDGIMDKNINEIFSSFGTALLLFFCFINFTGYTIVVDSILLLKEKEFEQVPLLSRFLAPDQDINLNPILPVREENEIV